MGNKRNARIGRSSSEAETSGLHARVEELRGRIDKLDDQLVRLLNERASHALEIGQPQACARSGKLPAREGDRSARPRTVDQRRTAGRGRDHAIV